MKRHIRPSFIIITVGAAAALGEACTSGSGVTTNPPYIAPDASADGPTVACPSTVPANGDPCDGTGSCQIDGGTNQCGYELGPTLQCVDGKWNVSYPSGGCNPGAPVVDAGSDAADEASSDAGDAGD